MMPMRHAVIFGGAGFIGSNVANRLLSQGQRVLIRTLGPGDYFGEPELFTGATRRTTRW